MSQRIKRVNETIKQEIGKVLLKEVEIDNILITVTNVDTSPDLKNCKVKISVIPSDKNELALEIINKKIYFIQQELNKKLHLKFSPKISFEIDKIESKAQKIEEILSM